jgi:hypothetical protein
MKWFNAVYDYFKPDWPREPVFVISRYIKEMKSSNWADLRQHEEEEVS